MTGVTLRGEPKGSSSTFPAYLARELRADEVEPLPPGTSPARVWRVTTPHGALAVKVLRRGAGIADGQDLGSFLREPDQLRHLRREVPSLGDYYVDVVGHWQRGEWAAYAMPFVEGSTAVTPGTDPQEARDRLRQVFRVLTDHGYARTRRTATTGFRREDLSQVRRRAWILQRHLPRELLDGPRVAINGRLCRPLEPLLQEVERATALLRRLRSRVVSYPVHGELDLDSVLAPPGSRAFTVIDPRGTRGYHDPVDDFARALLSMTTLDRMMTWGVRLWWTPADARRPGEYVLRSVDPHDRHPALGEWFVDMLGSLPFGTELDRVDPYWRARLAFAHGFCALLEATARLSDRAPAHRRRSSPPAKVLATALCAIGLRLLDQALAGAEGPGALPDISTGLDDDTAVVWRWGRRR